MSGFFGIDGPFYKVGNMLADLIILSLLWLLFSLPLVTLGASTVGLFYVSTKRISNQEGYLFRDYWKSFKQNFRQATLVWLLIAVAGGILIFNMRSMDSFGQLKNYLYPIQVFLFIQLVMISIFIFPLIARFEMRFPDLVKTAFFMANRHLLTTLLCLVVGVLVLLFSYVTGIGFFIAAGVYAFTASYFIMRVFRKYRPEIDPDLPDTLEP